MKKSTINYGLAGAIMLAVAHYLPAQIFSSQPQATSENDAEIIAIIDNSASAEPANREMMPTYDELNPQEREFEQMMLASTRPAVSRWQSIVLPAGHKIHSLLLKDNWLFAILDNGLYASRNESSSWSPMVKKLPQGIRFNASSASYAGRLFAGADSGLVVSQDNGFTWQYANSGAHKNAKIRAIVCLGSSLYMATDSGIYISNVDGINWTPLNKGLPGATNNGYGRAGDITSLATKGSLIFTATHGKVYRSSDYGSNWQCASKGIEWSVSSLACIDNTLIAGGIGVYVSENDGLEWQEYGPPADNNCSGKGCLPAAKVTSMSVLGQYLFAATADGDVYMSKDKGYSWAHAAGSLPSNSSVSRLQVCGRFLYAWTQDGRLFRLYSL